MRNRKRFPIDLKDPLFTCISRSPNATGFWGTSPAKRSVKRVAKQRASSKKMENAQ
jgi:hypothetical protein